MRFIQLNPILALITNSRIGDCSFASFQQNSGPHHSHLSFNARLDLNTQLGFYIRWLLNETSLQDNSRSQFYSFWDWCIWNKGYLHCRTVDSCICGWNSYNCVRKPENTTTKKNRTSTVLEPVTARQRRHALTNKAMKPLTLGAGQWCSGERIERIMYMKKIIYELRKWNEMKIDPRSCEHNIGIARSRVQASFSGFFTQLHKLRSQLRESVFISKRTNKRNNGF